MPRASPGRRPYRGGMTNTILLRRTLQANATFSLLAALDLVLFGRQIASVVGAIGPRELTILAVQLAVFAAWLLWLASRPAVPRGQVVAVIALDLAWIAGSVLVIAFTPTLLPGGKWLIGIVADLVAVFALLQWIGLRRLSMG